MRELKADDLLNDRYRIIQTLAKGGFGETYIAEDIKLPSRPKCVVKQLNPEKSHPKLLETAHRLFVTEAETLEQLGKHDQIPQLFAYFQEDEEFYLIQEFIEGHPLTEEIKIGEPWQEKRICQILQDVLQILEFIHKENVIHRDIKPENIIRRYADQKLVLVDFGTVKKICNHLASQGQVTPTVAIGTPGYMPTEQNRGNPRPSSDIYALGMIGIQVATGLNLSQLQEDLHSGEIAWRPWAQVSDELAEVLSKMVRYHFKDRYQSAKEVSDALLHSGLIKDLPTESALSVTNPSATDSSVGHSQNTADYGQRETVVSLPQSSSGTTITTPQNSSEATFTATPRVPRPTSVSTPDQAFGFSDQPQQQPDNSLGVPSFPIESQANLLQILKLAAIFGSGGWLLAVTLLSFLGTIWLVTGFWLVIAASAIFGLLARHKSISEKTLWFTVSIISVVVSLIVLPTNLAISPLFTIGFLGWWVILITALFAGALAFIVLTLAQSVSLQ